ncbi:MAG TPA: hypothetical protein VGV18_02850 [Verrucomicrobiae bacterium]|nr:hypothetical protein [Verrucomicrobiae bacterium]
MSENENDFETLRRLLALKRHEVPPPGYFEDFSGQVIERIRAAEAVRPMPWVLRFLQAFESKPAYPVTFASALCVLLLFGIVSIEQSPELVSSPPFPSTMDYNFSMTQGTQPVVAMVNTNPPVDVPLFAPSSSPTVETVDFSSYGN